MNYRNCPIALEIQDSFSKSKTNYSIICFNQVLIKVSLICGDYVMEKKRKERKRVQFIAICLRIIFVSLFSMSNYSHRPPQSMEPMQASVRDSQASSLLTNVSLDSELGQSINIDVNESHNRRPQSNQAVLSMESRPGTYTMPEYVDEDDLEVESLTSALSRVSRASENMQPPPPSHVKSMDSAPAVAGGNENGHQQSQYNGEQERVEPRHEPMRLDSVEPRHEPMRLDSVEQSDMASYASDSQSSLGYTLGGMDPEQSDYHRKKLTLDIQPVPIGQDRGRHQEKLMPAVVRPLKEKSQNANKQQERGVLSHSRSPRHTVEQNSKMTSWGNDDLSPDVEPSTPLSPESIADSLASDLSQRNKDNVSQKGQHRVPFQPLNQNISQEPQMAKGKHGEAFYIHAAHSDQNQHLQDDGMRDSMEDSRPYPAGSFTLVDKQYTMESAQQAGIPVVTSMNDGQRSLQRLHQAMDAVGGGGSPRVSQSNAYSHSYPHPNLQQQQQQVNPNHMPMHNPHAHTYSPSHSHSSSPLHTPSPQLHTPPPPPPGNPPHYPNQHYPSPHHTPQHSSPHRSSPQYPSQHASPQHSVHGHHPHSNPQYTGSVGGGNVGGGRVELTRFGNNAGMESSVTLSAPESNADKESPKLHADQTERESAFRAPVLLTFDSNLSPDKTVEAPVATNVVSNSNSQSSTNHTANSRYSPDEIALITKSQLNNHDQIDSDPLDDDRANLKNQKSDEDDVILSSDYITNKSHPKMTSWVSHSKHAPHINDINTGHGAPSHHNNIEPLAIGLAQVRLRLEEKRRNMDKEKRALERQCLKQRQRVGKAAFLQVLANQKRAKEPEKMVPPEEGTLGKGGNRPYSREEIERSLQDAQARWLQEQGQQGIPPQNKTTFAAIREKSQGGSSTHSRDSDSPRTLGRSDSPLSQVSGADIGGKGSPSSSVGSHSPPHMTPEQYTVSIDKMNENMSQLMKEIQKISLQQEQLKQSMESPRQQTTPKESPRAATLPRTGLHRPLSTSSSGSDGAGFVLHSNIGSAPEHQPFFLGGSSPPGPPQIESDNEPFVLQENPLFSMGGEQMSPPTGRPVGLAVQSPQTSHAGDSPHTSPRDNYDTYVVREPKSRPKLNVDMSATESLASKRGQQLTPIETNNISKSADGPMSLDDLDKSPSSQGFRLHGDESNESNSAAQIVQVDSYKAPVGFEIVDDPPTGSTPKRTPSLRERHREHQAQKQQREQQKQAEKAQKQQAEKAQRQQAEKMQKQEAEKMQKKEAEKVVPRRRNNSVGSPTKKRPPSVYEIVGETEDDTEIEDMVVKPLDESTGQDIDDSGETKVLGFVVAQEKVSKLN